MHLHADWVAADRSEVEELLFFAAEVPIHLRTAAELILSPGVYAPQFIYKVIGSLPACSNGPLKASMLLCSPAEAAKSPEAPPSDTT